MKLEPASRFNDAIMNWLLEYWTRSFDPGIWLTGSIFEKSIHYCILEKTSMFETYYSQQWIDFLKTEPASRILGSSEQVQYSNNQFIITFLKRLAGSSFK